MNIIETRKIITSYFEEKHICIECKCNKELIVNNRKYRIRPDDAFYFANKAFIMEYENNLRPVESISKYFWLFRQTDWLKENIKILMLITINNSTVEKEHRIRVESVRELGMVLKQLYPNNFDFIVLNYSELNSTNIIQSLDLLRNK